jgi:amidase
MAQTSSWKDLAEKKRNAILDSIPTKWRVEQSKLLSNEEQKDVTGYIQQFLSKRELEITETDVVGIAKETSTGNWTAAEVAEAFCHRASLAHQLVSVNWLRSTFFHTSHLMFLQKGLRVAMPVIIS